MEMLVLRLVHVMGAIFWVGSGIFTSFFLAPVLAKAGPSAGPVMLGLQQRKLFAVLPIVALLTILSGARLMQIASGGFSAAYFQSGMGRTFAFGAAAGIVAFLFGITFVKPTSTRMGKVGAALAAAQDNAERERLAAEFEQVRKRLGLGSMIATVLILVAASAMAIARYMA